MSKPRTGRRVSRRLSRVQQHVEQWRRNGGGQGRRMPEELWREAVAVAREEGLYATSRALRVDYSRLKERLSTTVTASAVDGQAAGFMELDLGQLRGGGTVVVELSDRDGSRMRVEVAAAVVDVTGLVRTFWSRRS